MLFEAVPSQAYLTPQKVEPDMFNRSVPEMKDPQD